MIQINKCKRKVISYGRISNRMKGMMKVEITTITTVINDSGRIFFIHLFTCAYIVWAISPPSSTPPPSPPTPWLPSRICSALISNFVEERV
jgi:hypothetical protein